METHVEPPPYKPEAQAASQLHHYIYQFDPRSDTVPKYVDPLQVERFVKMQLADAALTAGQAGRLAELADFYDVKQATPDFLKQLDGHEASEAEYLVSAEYDRIVGVLGDAEQREKGRAYYHYLLSQPYAEHHMPELLHIYDAYTPEEDAEATTTRINELIRDQSARAEQDYTAGVGARALQELRDNALPRIAAADQIRQEIQTLDDPAAYLDRLVDLYLRLDNRYSEFLHRWAVRMLLRSSYENGPEGPVAAFRRGLRRVHALDEPEETRRAMLAVSIHAILFFGGEVDEAERAVAQTLPGHLAGMLSPY